MAVYQLKREQFINRPLDEVFEFFSRPENLSRLTPTSVGFQVLTPPPIPMAQGIVIDYTIRALGLPVRWTTLISEYNPPYRFVDVQIKGPYSFWHHQHMFETQEEGTKVSDLVTYAPPFGLLGRGLHALFIRRQLETIFDYRHTALERQFGSAG